jgi:hypothetical protein
VEANPVLPPLSLININPLHKGISKSLHSSYLVNVKMGFANLSVEWDR